MSRPNSPVTRLRTWLARKLEPVPDEHEAWCVGCSMNGGRTLVLGSAAARDHVRAHQERGVREVVQVKVRERAGFL